MTIGGYYLAAFLLILLIIILVSPYIIVFYVMKYISNKISLKKYPELSENDRKMKMFNFRYWITAVLWVLIFLFVSVPCIIFL